MNDKNLSESKSKALNETRKLVLVVLCLSIFVVVLFGIGA